MSQNETISDQESAPEFSLRDGFSLFVRGLAMGAADVVPGVSGGTIAFITGIYERFINALRSLSPAFLLLLFRGKVRAAREAFRSLHWAVLIPVGLGVAVSVLTLSRLITGLMDDVPGPTYAFFFGLILASAWMPLAQVRTQNAKQWIALIIAAILAWSFVGLQPEGTSLHIGHRDAGAKAIIYPGKLRQKADLESILAFRAGADSQARVVVYDGKGILDGADAALTAGVDVHRDKGSLNEWLKNKPALIVLEEERASLLWVFICGILGISAMVLPGLSGSFLLLFLGQYHAIFSAIHRTLGHVLAALGKTTSPLNALSAHGATDDFAYVAVFFLGMLLGMATFSRVVSWLFLRAHDLTLVVLTGLMLGALRLPGEVVLASSGDGGGWAMSATTAILGVVLVGGLAWYDSRMRNDRNAVHSG